MYVDLAFMVAAERSIPFDHGDALYEAISRLLPKMHSASGVAIHPFAGRKFGDDCLMLMPWSALTFRLRADRIPSVLPLVGKDMRIGEASLSIGVPQVYALEPAATLRSRSVVIERAPVGAGQVTEEEFADAARNQLNILGISREVTLTLGKRRRLHFKDCEVIGYEVIVEGLAPRDSINLQEHGLGANRHMGCGIFLRYF
jgi:CRISPR-associated endonuclease/helicase Cas3